MTTALTVTVTWTSTVTNIKSAFVTMTAADNNFQYDIVSNETAFNATGIATETLNMTVIASATVTLKMIVAITILCH